jgi:hypothetical protein
MIPTASDFSHSVNLSVAATVLVPFPVSSSSPSMGQLTKIVLKTLSKLYNLREYKKAF